MNTSAQPPFKYARDTYSVRVENIAPCVGRHEIIELFSNLIGHVRKCEENVTDEVGRYMDISFFSRDASRKALCMSGYTVAGVPLSVCALAPPRNHNYANRVSGADDRRNLYVLGLPFNLTKTEYTELFAQYGTVEHAVILATVDNASRRRGFVVMTTHAEAKAAMDGLSRAEIKGHVIDVSWAVVQRSQGFLDGGDRSMGIAQRDAISSSTNSSGYMGPSYSPRGHFAQPSLSTQSSFSSLPNLSTSTSTLSSENSLYGRAGSPGVPTRPNSSAGTRTELEEHHVTRLVMQEPSAVLLVRDLPALLFSADQDLHPLFWPFGEVRRLERLRATASPTSRLSPPIASTARSAASSPLGMSTAVSPNVDADRAQDGKDDLKIATPNTDQPAKLSIVVEYATVASAIEARQSLHGQLYGTDIVRADFVELPSRVGSSPSTTDSLRASQGAPPFVPTTAADIDRDFTVQDRGMNKRHSLSAFGPTVDVTPSSPPRSARSFGGFYDRQAEQDSRWVTYGDRGYDAPPHLYNRYDAYDRFGATSSGYDRGLDGPTVNTHDGAFAGNAFTGGAVAEWERERMRQREYERERDLIARRAMYDRSNNTSPFPGGRGLLSPHAVHLGSSAAYTAQQGYNALGAQASENRFGAIARPLSSAARFPPEPVSAGAGPGGVPRSKFDELRYAEYPPMGPRRDARLFQSMPDVFDIPSAASGQHA